MAQLLGCNGPSKSLRKGETMGDSDAKATVGLTPRQQKWFASVRESLERETVRSLEDWVAIARTCPETKPRARLAWFKAEHGLGQNRASYVLSVAFPSDLPTWDNPDVSRMYFEALKWSLGLTDADVTPRPLK